MKNIFLLTVLASIFLSACGGSAPELTETDALRLSEDFFLSLDSGDVQNTIDEFFHLELAKIADADAMNELLSVTQFADPEDINVSSVESEGRLEAATGQFSCAHVEHYSDFNLKWLYNSDIEMWEITSFNFEECTLTPVE